MITQSVLRAKIANRVTEYKSNTNAAHAFGMTRQNLALILGGEPISDAVAKKFGYRLTQRHYEKIVPHTTPTKEP